MNRHERATARTESLVRELLQLYLFSKEAIPQKNIDKGKMLITLYESPNFGLQFQNYASLKKEVLWQAIHDLTKGGEGFRTGSFDIVFTHNHLEIQHKLFGDPSMGEVVFSLNFKKIAAFQQFKHTEADELLQDDTNNAMTYLITILSEL